MQKTIDELRKTTEELENQLENEKENKTKLESDIENLNGQKQELEEEVRKQQETISGLNDELTAKTAEINNLTGQIESKTKELETANNRIKELEASVTELTNQNNNLKTQVANLQLMQATGNATAADVLSGKTFSNASKTGITGTMVNRGTLNFNPSTSTSQTVQPGYYSGGTISTASAYESGYNNGKKEGLGNINILTATVGASYYNNSYYKVSKPSNCKRILGMICHGEDDTSNSSDSMSITWLFDRVCLVY